jgi:outer membrane protein, multidrug efflux system
MAGPRDLGYKGRVRKTPRRVGFRVAMGAVLLVATALLPLAVAAQPRAEEATVSRLADLVRAAERTFPSVEAAEHAIAAARAQLSEVKVSPFFQIEATGAFSMAPGAEGTFAFSPHGQLPLGNPWGPSYGAGLQGMVPLYTFGKLRAARAAARAGVGAAEADRDRTLADLRFDVRRAYFALQMALDIQQMVSEGRPKLVRAVRRLEERLEREDPSANMMDKWRLSAALAEVDARVSEAQMLEAVSRQALGTLTGLKRVRVPDCPLQAIPLDAKPLERQLDGDVASRPEARMLEAATDAREADLVRRRASFFPDIVLAMRADFTWTPGVTNQMSPFVQDPANRRALGAAIVARWSLDLWGNAHRVQQAESQLARTRAQAELAERGLRLEVSRTYQEVLDAQRREEAWGRGEREARSWFVAAVQAFEVGTVEPRDLVDALKAYFSARFSHLQATRELNQAVAGLERAAGRPLAAAAAWEAGCQE